MAIKPVKAWAIGNEGYVSLCRIDDGAYEVYDDKNCAITGNRIRMNPGTIIQPVLITQAPELTAIEIRTLMIYLKASENEKTPFRELYPGAATPSTTPTTTPFASAIRKLLSALGMTEKEET